MLNCVTNHEDENYTCPILSSDCPFHRKKFIQKITFGEHTSRGALDEMMESLIFNINIPHYGLSSSNQLIVKPIELEKTIQSCDNGTFYINQ